MHEYLFNNKYITFSKYKNLIVIVHNFIFLFKLYIVLPYHIVLYIFIEGVLDQLYNYKKTIRFVSCSKNRPSSRLGDRLGATRHSSVPIYTKSV